MTEAPLSVTDILLLLQAAIVIGGGFYFAGRLGAKIDHLSQAIEALRVVIATHGGDLRALENRVIRLESKLEDDDGLRRAPPPSSL